MPNFPRREADVVALANAMAAGYTAHAADFPSADSAGLTRALDKYNNAKAAQIEAMGLSRVAIETKNLRLDALEEIMRSELKKSEVDVGSDSRKLEYIGWNSEATPSPLDPPGQPRNLEPVNRGAGTLFLDWKAPAYGSGGPVRTYTIERRYQPTGGGEFSPWTQVGIALEPEVMLIDQPRDLVLEYRVRAVNIGGESSPSNTVVVVLDW
jgi:hypothetical protein